MAEDTRQIIDLLNQILEQSANQQRQKGEDKGVVGSDWVMTPKESKKVALAFQVDLLEDERVRVRLGGKEMIGYPEEFVSMPWLVHLVAIKRAKQVLSTKPSPPP